MALENEAVHYERRNNIDPIIIKVDVNCDRIIPLPAIIQVKEMRSGHSNQRSEASSTEYNDSPPLHCNENEINYDNRDPPNNSISGVDLFVEDRRSLELRESNSSVRKFVFTFPGTLMFYITSLSFITLIPYHDVVLFPHYWYELLIPAICGFLSGCSLLVLHQVSKILDDSSILNYEFLRMIFALPSIAITISHIAVHFIWSIYFGYNSPIPFVVFILLVPWFLTFGYVFWHYFIRICHDNPTIISKLKFYCFYLLTNYVGLMSCLAIFVMYLSMNEYTQWMNVILLAVSRKIFGTFMCKLICQASVDNINQEEQLLLRKEELLMKLIVNEITELLTPVIFVITFVMAYAGPNATTIGNVQNNYWHYHKIEDPFSYISGILFMTVIDFLSAGISLILVWGLYKINCWSFIREKVAALFTIMALNVAFAISGVSNSNISNVQNYDKDNH